VRCYLGYRFNAPKGGNAVLTLRGMGYNDRWKLGFNAPKGGNAVLTLHYEYFN